MRARERKEMSVYGIKMVAEDRELLEKLKEWSKIVSTELPMHTTTLEYKKLQEVERQIVKLGYSTLAKLEDGYLSCKAVMKIYFGGELFARVKSYIHGRCSN